MLFVGAENTDKSTPVLYPISEVVGSQDFTTSQSCQTYFHALTWYAPGPQLAMPEGVRNTGRVARELGSLDNDTNQWQTRQELLTRAHAHLVDRHSSTGIPPITA
jgi:hypothetical protein